MGRRSGFIGFQGRSDSHPLGELKVIVQSGDIDYCSLQEIVEIPRVEMESNIPPSGNEVVLENNNIIVSTSGTKGRIR
ncbi:MAG: hypothetical protein AB2693_10475 [Candidatus Thiodiazotropha sp.]